MYRSYSVSYVYVFLRGSCGVAHGPDSRARSVGSARVWEKIKHWFGGLGVRLVLCTYLKGSLNKVVLMK